MVIVIVRGVEQEDVGPGKKDNCRGDPREKTARQKDRENSDHGENPP